MSVFEPHTDDESGGASQLPALDVALRGRKGQQVSAYIQDLRMHLDQQRARADQAERAAAHIQHELSALRNQPPPSFEHLGSQAARVLDEAGRSAKVLVEEAKGRGKAIVEQARGHGAEVIAAAEQRAEEVEAGGRQRVAEAEERREQILAEVRETAERLRASAEHDAETRLDAARQAAEHMLAKANGERSALEAESKRLRQYRDGLLGYLSGVEADLARFLEEVRGPQAGPATGRAAGPESRQRPATVGHEAAPSSGPGAVGATQAEAPANPDAPDDPDSDVDPEPEAASAPRQQPTAPQAPQPAVPPTAAAVRQEAPPVPQEPSPAPETQPQPQPPAQSAIGGVRAGN
jgi:vacuolar-type H+-ATPase subunit H